MWENLRSWRDESSVGSIEILEDVSFRVILKDLGSKWQCLPFCSSCSGGCKKGSNRARGHWFLNVDLRHQPRTNTRGSGKFQAEPVSFFVRKRIAFNYSLALNFYALIIGFFRYAFFRSTTHNTSHKFWDQSRSHYYQCC